MTILEDYLDGFDGIIIIVSHDRYFLDRTVRRIFSFESGGVIRQFEGGYSDYLLKKEIEALDAEENTGKNCSAKLTDLKKNSRDNMKSCLKDDAKNTWKNREKKLRFTFKEQKEFETIDDDIAALEEKIEIIDKDISANATNSMKLGELVKEKEETEKVLEEKMERWVYLNDLNERIENSK